MGYSLRLYDFEFFHIKEEVSHSKCYFSYSGSCTRIPYLQMLEKGIFKIFFSFSGRGVQRNSKRGGEY